jgi:DNA-binding response OmpR family regulator
MTSPPHLLVVDDEAIIRAFLVRALEGAGYRVSAAADGHEALARMHEMPIDLVLTDIRMDHMDGVALLREVRARHPDTVVLLLTGHAALESAIAAVQHGALNYLLKPVRNEEIIEAVKAALVIQAHQARQRQIEAIARQFAHLIAPVSTPPADDGRTAHRIVCGMLSIDLHTYTAVLGTRTLALTPTELRLLAKFAASPGAVSDYVTLVRDACGYTCARHEAQEIINAHIRNLRHKIGVDAGRPFYIEAVRGIGYRMIPPHGEG